MTDQEPNNASAPLPSNSPMDNLKRLLKVPTDIIDDITYKIKHLPETNYQQACEHADKGYFKDAIFRLKVVLWMAPDHARAHYLMGACYSALGNKQEAIKSFNEALRLEPNNDETLFMIATVNERALPEGKYPTTIPFHMARDYFDKLADNYEIEQRELGYQGHLLMDEFLRQHIDTKQINHRVLELGCGTGLCGRLVQDIAGHLTGVDFSRKMLDQAMNLSRKDGELIYDRTILRDLRDYLADIKKPVAEIIIASHVFNYVGDLEAVFRGAYQALEPDGLFLFQAEPKEGDGFGVLPSLGRFGHSEMYIQKLAEKHQFEILQQKSGLVYPDYTLMQYALRKK